MRIMFTIGIIIMSFLSLFAQSDGVKVENEDNEYVKDATYRIIENTSFRKGEEIDYKATFGWFTVGKGKIKVQPKYHIVNNRQCFKIDVYGKTSGFVDWLAKVDDHWGSYVDTASFVAQRGIRDIKEGKHRMYEITDFDHVNDRVSVKAFSRKQGKYTDPKFYDTPNNVVDMISGYFFLRTVDFTKLTKGDTIKVQGFLEDTFYDLAVIHAGKETIRTKAGKFNTIKLVPVMPENTLFDGKDSVATWISDDENKIPVKVKAEMFIGSAGLEVTSFKNLQHKPNIQK